MCDYSLQGLPNRLAIEGEELVVHRFKTGSIGLTSKAELLGAVASKRRPEKNTLWSMAKALMFAPALPAISAVCIPPGARLRVLDIPVSLQDELDVRPEENVVFTQTRIVPNEHRDAIQFANGRQILLQALKEGQRVRVLSLASNESDDPQFVAETMGEFSIPRVLR